MQNVFVVPATRPFSAPTTRALLYVAKRLGSASELPVQSLRKLRLPGPTASRSRFSHLPRIFARTALSLLPVVLVFMFVAARASHRNRSSSVPVQVASAPIDGQIPVDPLSAPFAKRAIYPFSIVP